MTAQNRLLAHLRSGDYLTAERLTGYARLLAAGNILFLVLAICRAHGWLISEEPHFSTEFLSFYAAGRLVDAGHAALVYAPGMAAKLFIASSNMPPAHVAMERLIAHDPKIIYFGFFYPPVYWLICAPLAVFSYIQAYLLWLGGSFFLLAVPLRRLAGGWRKAWPALAYLGIFENAVGENSFLSAGLIGFSLLRLNAAPWLAGACFGAVCYKPHFLLPVFLFLLIGRNFAAAAAAALSAGALCLLSAMLFGWQNWKSYFAVIVPHAEWVFGHAGVAYDLQVTPWSAIMLLGGGGTLAALVQGGAMAFAVAVMVATRNAGPNIRAACLTASFPLLASVMLDYDLTITGLAVLFLWREARETGFLPWEKTACVAMFLLPLFTYGFRTSLGIPLDPLIPAGFLWLLLRRRRAALNGGAALA
jgi:hypothetical protein